MRFTLVTVATLVAAGALAVATPDNHVIHEAREPVQGWRKASKLEKDVPLPVRIGLTQSNLHRAHELLMDVSVSLKPNGARVMSQPSS
jgi:tripeptidyl-peptidase-1